MRYLTLIASEAERVAKTVYLEYRSGTPSLTIRPIQRHLCSQPPFRSYPNAVPAPFQFHQIPKTNHAVKAPTDVKKGRGTNPSIPQTPAKAKSPPPRLLLVSSLRQRPARDDPAPLHGARGGGRGGGDAALQDAAAEADRARARPSQAGARARHGAYRGGHRPRPARVQPPQHGSDPRPRRGGDRRRRGRGAHPHRPGPHRAPPPRGLAHGYALPVSRSVLESSQSRFNSVHHLRFRGSVLLRLGICREGLGERLDRSRCTIQEPSRILNRYIMG